MTIPYLKIEPEEAVKNLEEWIIKGYRIKICIENDYNQMKNSGRWGDNSSTLEMITKWREWVADWTNACGSKLFEVFVSSREVYNFQDAKPPFGVTSEDVRYIGILDILTARINTLNKYTEFIFHEFNVKFSVQAGRDAILQTGNNSTAEVKND